MKPHLALSLSIVGSSVAIAASPENVLPTASELFSIVDGVRTSASSDHIADPGVFARDTLETSLRRIDKAGLKPQESGLNWQRDAILSSLSAFQSEDFVYSYEISSTDLDPVALRMYVSRCGRPSTLTVGFRFEEGRWRIHSKVSDTTVKGTSWFHSGLKPIRLWPHIALRDRSRYFNESELGRALDLNSQPLSDC